MNDDFVTVSKPSRYMGREINSLAKDPRRVRLRFALAFPDVYEIAMSYLGQKILYDVLNSRPDFLAERVFAPWPDMEEGLRSRGRPLLSLENKIPLAHFDILGFSLLYELNYSNILTILDLGRIPFLAEEREAFERMSSTPNQTVTMADYLHIMEELAWAKMVIRELGDRLAKLEGKK
jgi:hypothetical protein